jgi:CBS domain-containing protein
MGSRRVDVMTMARIRDLLRFKGGAVWTVGPEATVYEALELMAAKDVGAVIVVDGGGVAGVFSERDYARRVILKGKASRTLLVREIMTAPVLYVRPEQSVGECMALMTEKRVRHLPVLDGGELVGIVTIGDLVRHVISEQRYTIEQLENYITGTL